MAFRVLHTADWQIGFKAKVLGAQAEKAREARFIAAQRVVEIANAQRVNAVFLAGDTFEDSSVERGSVQRIVDLLRRSQAPVYVLPGNHDPLVAHGVFDHAAWRDAAPHVTVLRDARPLDLGGATLLPSPVYRRHSATDPLSVMPAPDGAAGIRIGVAHGSVLGAAAPDADLADDFPIDLKRLEAVRLDYLALGHWHCPSQYESGGAVRAAYCGTHEPTRMGESAQDGRFRSGQCLVVTIEAPGAPPVIEEHRTAVLSWETRREVLYSAEEIAALRARLDAEPSASREKTLLALTLEGSLTLSEAAALAELETLLAARFLHARVRRDALRVRPDDARWIETLPAGAPVAVAQALLREVTADGPDATVAERALVLLHELQHAADSE